MEQSASSNVEIVNEILEVFRHIISNYAGSVQKLPDSNCTIIVHLVTLFSQIFDQYMGQFGIDAEEEDFSEIYSEQSITIQNILRIMTHIVLRVPLRDNEEQASVLIYGTALKQSMLALKLSKKNLMLQEFSLTLCVSTLRVLANAAVQHKDEPCAKVGQ